MIDSLSTKDLVRIAAAGGGFTISASRGTDDLVRIAGAAAGKSARVRITNAAALGAENLVRIASAGCGAVEFA